jgi:hypothetical protein
LWRKPRPKLGCGAKERRRRRRRRRRRSPSDLVFTQEEAVSEIILCNDRICVSVHEV